MSVPLKQLSAAGTSHPSGEPTHHGKAANVYWFLGLPLEPLDVSTAMSRIEQAAFNRRQLIFGTPNVNFLAAVGRDPHFRDCILATDLNLVDGMPLVWLGRLLGIPFAERVAGATIIERFVRETRARELKLFFFGGEEGVGEAACTYVNSSPGLSRAVGWMNPGFGTVEEMSTPDIIDAINESGADVLVVALGARKGHAWIEHNRQVLTVPVVSHLGAVVNFLAGSVRRAPNWMQHVGLEWLWRTLQEPALIKRYILDGLSLAQLCYRSVLPLLIQRGVRAIKDHSGLSVTADNRIGVSVEGALVEQTVPQLEAALAHWDSEDRGERELTMDLSGLSDVDCRGLGYLYYISRQRVKRNVRLAGSGRRLERLLSLHRAHTLLERSVPTAISADTAIQANPRRVAGRQVG